MALTATILGSSVAILLSFRTAHNLAPNSAIYWVSRRFLELCRGVPEIHYALVFVFAVGIGPLAGVLAIAIHSAGALGKLFSAVNENASLRPVERIRSVGMISSNASGLTSSTRSRSWCSTSSSGSS